MELAALITQDVVKIPLEAVDKEEAIAELVEVLVRARKVADRNAILDKLYSREAKGSTGIGGGVAVPHAKGEGVRGVAVAAGISRGGIEFDAADGELVYLVFLVLAEVTDPGLSVEILAQIGNLTQVPGLCKDLRSVPTAGEFIRLMQEAQVAP
jgi:mannitol/fructose-specific phosphotransferase system IIA component (Ntr-type)